MVEACKWWISPSQVCVDECPEENEFGVRDNPICVEEVDTRPYANLTGVDLDDLDSVETTAFAIKVMGVCIGCIFFALCICLYMYMYMYLYMYCYCSAREEAVSKSFPTSSDLHHISVTTAAKFNDQQWVGKAECWLRVLPIPITVHKLDLLIQHTMHGCHCVWFEKCVCHSSRMSVTVLWQ